MTPHQALEEGAPLIRDDKEGQADNRVYHWEAGDAAATDAAFAQADRVVTLSTFYPRSHPSPLECCGCIADVNSTTDILVQEGDTDNTPYGLGTYASRSTPTAGAAAALVARHLREKARKIAAYLLEVAEEDLEWEGDRFSVRGAPEKVKTIQEVAFAAYTNHPQGMDAGLEGVKYYDPPT